MDLNITTAARNNHRNAIATDTPCHPDCPLCAITAVLEEIDTARESLIVDRDDATHHANRIADRDDRETMHALYAGRADAFSRAVGTLNTVVRSIESATR